MGPKSENVEKPQVFVCSFLKVKEAQSIPRVQRIVENGELRRRESVIFD